MIDLILPYCKERDFFVEVGASAGGTNPTLPLTKKWDGLWIECDDAKHGALCGNYPHVKNLHLKITPENVATLDIPVGLGLWVLDIDGYDYDVLDKILPHYQPKFVICEVNEKIPPPINFHVKYSPDWKWEGHFYGMSICALDELCKKYGYSIIKMECENVLIGNMDCLPIHYKGAAEAYIPWDTEWNKDVAYWQKLPPQEAMEAIMEYFRLHTDYEIHL